MAPPERRAAPLRPVGCMRGLGGTLLEPAHSISLLLGEGCPELIGLLRFLCRVGNEAPFAKRHDV
jgi:hypothetical protein